MTWKVEGYQSPLPDVMSELLTVAIEDAESLDPGKYYPFHGVWHAPRVSKYMRCRVCLAGAVMARTFGALRNMESLLSSYTQQTKHKLLAINDMRQGHFLAARSRLICLTEADTDQNSAKRPDVANVCMKASEVVRKPDFMGWQQFNEHLESLKKARDILKEGGL